MVELDIMTPNFAYKQHLPRDDKFIVEMKSCHRKCCHFEKCQYSFLFYKKLVYKKLVYVGKKCKKFYC